MSVASRERCRYEAQRKAAVPLSPSLVFHRPGKMCNERSAVASIEAATEWEGRLGDGDGGKGVSGT